VHEVGHNYVHGILANNEWREGWLDEGFVSFLTNWALEERAVVPVNWTRDLEGIQRLEQRQQTQAIALPSAEFRDPATYGAMTYTKASLVFRMLRWVMGDDAFRAALRQYYADHKLQHVTEADLRAAVNAHSPAPLDWFFDQWIHTTHTLDYRIGEVTTSRAADGRWQTRVEVVRAGEIWMPVELAVNGVTQRLDSRERRQIVTVTSTTRPNEARLDPQQILLDIDSANNRKALAQ